MDITLETIKSEKLGSFANAFEQGLSNGLSPFIPLPEREKAFELFSALGFPSKKDEEWKYTSTRVIERENFLINPTEGRITSVDPHITSLAGESYLMVFHGSTFVQEVSVLPKIEGVTIGLLSQHVDHPAVKEHLGKYAIANDSMVALNQALASDGLFLHINKGAKMDKPLHLIFLGGDHANNEASAYFIRNLVIAESDSFGDVIESYRSIGSATNLYHVVTEVRIEQNAQVNFHKLQMESNNSIHFNHMAVDQEQNSHSDVTTLTMGGKWVRNNLNHALNDTNCETHFYGLYVLNENMHVDNHTLADHIAPNCMSNELYKGIMDDKSNGVFNGKIIVRQPAQKTNAYQSNKNILLSDNATINTKPQLEIFADDVKCSHGATTGQLDEESLFYLRARGIEKEKAKQMLLFAFAGDVINNIKIETLKENLLHLLAEKFNQEEVN